MHPDTSTKLPSERSEQPMQLSGVTVTGLFGRYAHDISFVVSTPGIPGQSSVTLIHGQNGVGKTTILKMIEGALKMDFSAFRTVPFTRFSLRYGADREIEVQSKFIKGTLKSINVSYKTHSVQLHPTRAGALLDPDAEKVDRFRLNFSDDISGLRFELVSADRFLNRVKEPEETGLFRLPDTPMSADEAVDYIQRQSAMRRRAKLTRPSRGPLADRVARFISDAQANYRRFFATSEPDLFPKILQIIENKQIHSTTTSADLVVRLKDLSKKDADFSRYGLAGDPWDLRKLTSFLQVGKKSKKATPEVLAVIASYTEALESRYSERALVADRLRRFEEVLGRMLLDKTVSISPNHGFAIKTASDATLNERQLSSGEYHLLYLAVSALVTQRTGTVLAIDEPELSLHIGWQRKLVNSLVECAAGAEPQFILATHSPDIASDFPESLRRLEPAER